MKRVMRWDDSLSVGSDIIDNEHKILFDLANDLNNAVNMGAKKQVLDTLFSVIINYAFKHFETEENRIIDEKDFSKHCMQHYQLIKQLHDYSVDFRNNRITGIEPGEFLENWLLDHIRTSDIPALTNTEIDVSFDEDIDELDDFDAVEIDRRQYKRVRYDKLLDEDIIGHCYNANTMKTTTVTIVDLAGGGLKIFSDQKFNVDDLLIISCRVGKNFKMREKVQVKNKNKEFYGVEFVSPSRETVKFLTEVSGAVHHYY